MLLSAPAFQYSSVMELAMRSARSGSVAVSALATSISADAFESTRMMELAVRSASLRRRAARSGSVAASAWRPLSALMPSSTRR